MGKEHIEGRKAAVYPSDVLLHVYFLLIAEVFALVYVLLQDPQSISYHDDLMEKGFNGNFFSFQIGIARV